MIEEKIGLLEKDDPKATDLPIIIPKGDDTSESDSEDENSTESEFSENKLLEEEEGEEEETLEESDLQKAIERIDVEGKIIEKEADNEMSDAQYLSYEPITEPECYSFDDYGLFLLENCKKFGLDGENASLALSQWLSSPSQLTMNMQLHAERDNIFQNWSFFKNVKEFKDLATFAQILLTNTASEAACEREFWKQRKILTNERNRTGSELAFARIVFMTIKNE